MHNEEENKITSVLFNEQPEAWLHGPVFKSLYQEYKSYGWHEVKKINKNIEFENNEIKPFLDKIYNAYSKYDADELEFMTHQEAPWKVARNGVSALGSSNNKIDVKEIFKYFNSLANE